VVPQLLEFIKKDGEGKSDIDLYISEYNKSVWKNFGPSIAQIVPRPIQPKNKKDERQRRDGWTLECKPEVHGNVKKHKFMVGDASLHIDVVKRGRWTLPGSDLFASIHCLADASEQQTLTVALFHDGPGFPPLELTLHSALRYGAGAPVSLYTFRPAICPSALRNNPAALEMDPSLLNVDGRFQRKLLKREDSGLVKIIPMWLPWAHTTATVIRATPHVQAIAVDGGGEEVGIRGRGRSRGRGRGRGREREGGRGGRGGRGEEMVNQIELDEAQDADSSGDEEVRIGAGVDLDDDVGGVLPAEWDFDYASDYEVEDTDMDMDREAADDIPPTVLADFLSPANGILDQSLKEAIKSARQHSDIRLNVMAPRDGVLEGELNNAGRQKRASAGSNVRYFSRNTVV